MSTPGILQRLRSDHRRVLRDLDLVDRELQRGRTAAPVRSALHRVLARLARQFDTHMAAEDERLYPAFAAMLPEANPGLEMLRAEHVELRSLLAGLTAALRLPPDSRRDETVRVQWSDFSELLRIHIRKEESVVFHVAERVVPEKEWRRIAARRFPGTAGGARASQGSRKEHRS